MATHKDGGLVARSVREALGTLLSPELHAQLVVRALHSAGLSDIPEHGNAVGHWINGALLREIETTVGADAAELIAEQLAPVIGHAANSERAAASSSKPAARKSQRPRIRSHDSAPPGTLGARHKPSQRDPFMSDHPTGAMVGPKPTNRTDHTKTARLKLTADQLEQLKGGDAGHTHRPPPSDQDERELPHVLVASSARGEIDALQSYLRGTAYVASVSGLVGLLDALDDKSLVEPIVLLDCQRPTVHVTSLASIGEDLPIGTTIVLWGASEDTWNQLDRERTPTCKWVRCSHEATTGDVGSLCSMLIRHN